jgi:hypothetical protein
LNDDPKMVRLIIKLQWCEPQDVIAYKRSDKFWKVSIRDRLGRSQVFIGEHVGFNVWLWQPMQMWPITKIVTKGFWDEAFYVINNTKSTVEIILKETMDI